MTTPNAEHAHNHDDIDHLIELRGVYDGWSIAVYLDGCYLNRWDKGGKPIRGYERRWRAAEDAIADMRKSRGH